MTNQNQYHNIPADKFRFAKRTDLSHDKKFDTKPVSYFQGAWRRFCKNKGAVVGGVVILFLVLFAIIAPFFTPYTPSYHDKTFLYVTPKLTFMEEHNIPFWDGGRVKSNSTLGYLKDLALEQETGKDVIKSEVEISEDGTNYTYRYDTYFGVGFGKYKEITRTEFDAIQAYQNETGKQVLYPLVHKDDRPSHPKNEADANIYYKVENPKAATLRPVLDEDGNVVNNYWRVEPDNKSSLVVPYNSLRLEGEEGVVEYIHVYDENGMKMKDENGEYVMEAKTYYYVYGRQMPSTVEVRVDYYEYYTFLHAQEDDDITAPLFIFGTDDDGRDIFACLAYGARFSFIFASVVALVNFIVGVIWGSISGYFGGALDLAMERFCEVLGSVPSMIIITLLKFHLGRFILEHGLYQLVDIQSALILFIAFFATGWIGMAGRTRMQFYRFKNQEYVLAARTLGAGDARIMFKHIFPNGIGTIVTSVALVIPSMIYSETSLSYLGIINLDSGKLTSVGTLIAAGQEAFSMGEGYLAYVALFPCLFLVLLMLSFNLFGNGLRDAFNPSLRGSEE